MDESKKRRLAYKRRWNAAKKFLSSKFLSVDEDHGNQSSAESSSVTDAIETFVQSFDEQGPSNIQPIACHTAHQPWEEIDELNDTVLSSDVEESDVFSESLASWVNVHNVKHNAIDDLLKLLQRNGHPELPATARTLLKTSRDVDLEERSGMKYIYLGLENQVRKHFLSYPEDVRSTVNELSLSFNIDGLPLFKSTNCAVWPILCQIHLQPRVVFPVALTCGVSKPKNLDFTLDTIRDINNIVNNCLVIEDRMIDVNLKYFVCDAPARAMVKRIKQYSGYYGCDRCVQKGVWLNKVTYQDVDSALRTDESFRSQQQEEHHVGATPYCNLPLDMIKGFPVDYMHQSCLGAMKRLLLVWMRGPKETKMSAAQIAQVSAKLRALRRSIPSNFARKPRELEDVERWKATEFRQFLLYTGKLVLKGVLKQDLYKHFLTLSVAISLLICPGTAKVHADYASELLQYFVIQSRILYGPEFLVYNVHCLLHLAEDVKTYGSLDEFSAFPFENYLCKLKKLVRSGKNPLAQICRRLGEKEDVLPVKKVNEKVIYIKSPDNAFFTAEKKFGEVVSIENSESVCDGMYLCRVYDLSRPAFMYPCDSRLIGVHEVSTRNCELKLISRREMSGQAIMMQQDSATAIFLAVLHHLEI